MNIIELESRDNRIIKNLSKLKLKKYREKEDRFVVENWKIIQDAAKSENYFSETFVTKNFLDKNKSSLEDLLKENELENLFLLPEKLVNHISALKNPEGIWAVYKKGIKKADLQKDIVYLNGINDPGNLGTILRSCVAFGLENIVLDEKCADIYNPKTVQSAKDSIFKLNISKDKSMKILLEIKENKTKIYITDVREGEELEKIFFQKEKFCLILGSESRGVSPELSALADGFINIKTTDKMESLNVAVSAGIIFYEFFKSRRK